MPSPSGQGILKSSSMVLFHFIYFSFVIPWDQIANVCWIIEKAREYQKNICFIDSAKAFDCVDHNKLWEIPKEIEYQTIWHASWEICMQVRRQQLELDMEQTGSK